MGQPASVQALNQIWYDKLEPEEGFQRSSVTFVLSVLSLGLLAPFLMKYRPGVDPTPLPSLHANGINYCDPSQRSTTMNYPRRFLQFHQSLHAKFVYHLVGPSIRTNANLNAKGSLSIVLDRIFPLLTLLQLCHALSI